MEYFRFSILISLSILFLQSCKVNTQDKSVFMASADSLCKPCLGSGTSGPDFSGKNLVDFNFTTYDKSYLKNANFQNAVLEGAQFQNMDLSGANFQGATLTPSAKGHTNFSGAILTGTCFLNANADSCNFQFVTLNGTDFTCASLIQADFGPMLNIQFNTERTKFINTSLDIPHFPLASFYSNPSYWQYTDFSFTEFRGLTKSNINFRGWNMENAVVRGIDLTGFDLSKCNLNKTDFSYANLKSVTFDSSTMIGINLNFADMSLSSIRYVTLYDSVYNKFVSAQMNSSVLTNADMSYSVAQYAQLRNANLNSATLLYTDFRNAIFSANATYSVAQLNGANAAYANFSFANINEVRLNNAYLNNALFNHVTMQGTNFQSATLSSANFSFSTLQGVSFNGAILHNAVFQNTTIQGTQQGANVDFSCSLLGGSDFTNSTVVSANFANAVVPPVSLCCPQMGNTYKCGVDDRTGLVYGKTILPRLNAPVTCPNGQNAVCDSIQWQIPNWTSSDCNPNHQKQILWVPPNCSQIDSSQIITFNDPDLRQCIADQYFGGNLSTPMTKDMAKQIINCSCSGYGISDLSGMQFFTGLQELDMSNNQITDSEVWTYFTLLQKLNVQNNKLAQIDLSGLSSLIQLNASHNQIGKVLGAGLLNLYDVDLSYNSLTQFPLDELDYVYFADLSHNLLQTVGKLDKNIYLVTLYLENNSLVNIGSLAKATGLAYVDLSCNPGLDCKSLGVSIPTQCGNNSGPGCKSAFKK